MGKKHREQMVVPQEIEVEVEPEETHEVEGEPAAIANEDARKAIRRNMAYPHFLRRST